MDNLINILIVDTTYSWNHNVFVYFRVDFDNINLKIVQFFLSPVVWSPRTTLIYHKITIFKRFRCIFLNTNIKFKGTWWNGIVRVKWIVINWSRRMYNGAVGKMTQNNPNYLIMSHVAISQFHIGLGLDKHRKVCHENFKSNIWSSVFMKQNSWDCLIFEEGASTSKAWSICRLTPKISSS